MKIVSPFRDYYDNVVQYGADRETLYIRKTPEEEQIYPVRVKGDLGLWRNSMRTDFWETFLVRVGNLRFLYMQKRVRFYYSFTTKECEPDALPENRTLGVNIVKSGNVIHIGHDKAKSKGYECRVEAALFDIDIPQVHPVELIALFNIGFTRQAAAVIPNPNLSNLNIQSVLHPASAYQEIYTWLCNRSNPEKPIVNVENDVRIQQHGFDLKTSFRKEKTKK